MKIDRDVVVCDCVNLTYGEIVDAIKNNNLKTVEEIMDETDAGNYCGYCKCKAEDEDGEKELHLDEILEEVLKND